jgi:DNA-binding response OmpR family regulator
MRGAACVIEPDEITRDQLSAQLRAIGFSVHETANGELGILIASQVPLQLTIVSLALPDGLKLIRRLRRSDKNLTIVGLDYEPLKGVAGALARFAGADAVIAAPASSEAICAAINETEQPAHLTIMQPPEAGAHLTRV